MTDSTLKCVVVLDPETQGYKPAAHNLTASDAANLAQQFSSENKTSQDRGPGQAPSFFGYKEVPRLPTGCRSGLPNAQSRPRDRR
jgi:hypothetical protein